MVKMIKAGMIAIAFTATTTVMAQSVDETAGVNATSETTVQSVDNGHRMKDKKHGEHKNLTCPKCGTEIAMPHHKGMRQHGRKGRGNKGHGEHVKMHNFVAPEIGAVVDTLPRGAMSYVKDGKQMFGAYGIEYEPMADAGAVKYKVVGKKEKK